MMQFGKSLRAAREAKGLTVAQLAETTHLAPTMVEDLENENFGHIAAPIYGRGFVRLYCETVGLAPQPYIDEFMSILTGAREPSIRERPVASPEPSVESAATERLSPEPEPAPQPPQDLFLTDSAAPTPAAPAPAVPTPAAPTPVAPLPLPAEDDESVPADSRYATPLRTGWNTPSPAFWRLGLLAVAALAVLALLIVGLRALRHATAPEEQPSDVPAVVTENVQPSAVQPTTAPAQPRTPQSIPQLYLD